MVTLLPSQATRQIVVYPAEVPTSMTLNTVNDALEGETFMAAGHLTRNDNGEPIANQPIKLYSNTTLLATANTDAAGLYSFNVSIATQGTYTLKADFIGADVEGYARRLGASSAKATIGKANIEALKPYLIPALIVAGTAYLLKKIQEEPTFNTQINIEAPAEVHVAEPFTISGVLETQTESGWVPLANKPIYIYISNKYLTTTTTDSTGAYSASASINEDGDYMLKSAFKGEDGEEPKEIPWVPLLVLLGAIALVRS